MKVATKRLLLAFCVVLCVATAGWCIDPFKANKGGFGPKIKGVQLGMKMSLLDLVVWGASLEDWPFSIRIEANDGSCHIEFTGEGQELKGFNVRANYINDRDGSTMGVLAPFKNKQGKLGDILAEIEKLRLKEAVVSYTGKHDVHVELNEDMRVKDINLSKFHFGAEQMKPKEFALAIMDAYHIPGMDGERGGWRHRNLSEGWEIFCGEWGLISVSPIVTQSKFD